MGRTLDVTAAEAPSGKRLAVAEQGPDISVAQGPALPEVHKLSFAVEAPDDTSEVAQRPAAAAEDDRVQGQGPVVGAPAGISLVGGLRRLRAVAADDRSVAVENLVAWGSS